MATTLKWYHYRIWRLVYCRHDPDGHFITNDEEGKWQYLGYGLWWLKKRNYLQ